MIMQVYRRMIYCSLIYQNSCPPHEISQFFLLKINLNKYIQKTTFTLKMWSKMHIWANLRFLCEIYQNVSIFVEKLKKIQPSIMIFRNQLEPSIMSYECFMFLQNFRFGNHNGLMDSWKTLIVFFLSKTEEE